MALGCQVPLIASVPATLTHDNTYSICDDAQQATNFPIVRIVNNATGHVFYARTHNHSFMGGVPGRTVSTKFDVPTSIETGASELYVVANGVASSPVAVTVN